jgi:hypothetical protein
MYVLLLWRYREQRPSWRDRIEQPEHTLDQGRSLAPLRAMPPLRGAQGRHSGSLARQGTLALAVLLPAT